MGLFKGSEISFLGSTIPTSHKKPLRRNSFFSKIVKIKFKKVRTINRNDENPALVIPKFWFRPSALRKMYSRKNLNFPKYMPQTDDQKCKFFDEEYRNIDVASNYYGLINYELDHDHVTISKSTMSVRHMFWNFTDRIIFINAFFQFQPSGIFLRNFS